MRVGAFEISEPLPELDEPHALVMLQPWVDVGDVGYMTMELLENHLHASLLGELGNPDSFFDYTRYRPVIQLVEGKRKVQVPNSYINYARQPEDTDFLLLHLLEPHMLGRVYVNSILEVLQRFGAKRYCLIGSMYDMVPHTRPLIVSGRASGQVDEELRHRGVQPSDYEGPTTILTLVSQEAPKYGMEAMSFIVHLPQYIRLERDYAGILRLAELIASLYRLPLDLEAIKLKASEQNEELDQAMEREPQLKQAVQQLEELYQSRAEQTQKEQSKLSPQIEEFLRDVTKRFGQDKET